MPLSAVLVAVAMHDDVRVGGMQKAQQLLHACTDLFRMQAVQRIPLASTLRTYRREWCCSDVYDQDPPTVQGHELV